MKWARSKSFEEFKKKVYAFHESKKSQQYQNLMAVLEGKLGLIQQIQGMGLTTKALTNTQELMNSLVVQLNKRADLFDRINWNPGPGMYAYSLVTQPMLQRRPNRTELISMDSFIQILCRFQKCKRKVPPLSLLSTKK